MHKLTRVEAERVMAVLQETLEKLTQLRVIPSQYNAMVAKELKLDGAYKASDALSDLWNAETNRSGDVRPLTRGFLRLLRNDPQVLDALDSYADKHPSPAVEDFIDALRFLKDITFRKLSTTVGRALPTSPGPPPARRPCLEAHIYVYAMYLRSTTPRQCVRRPVP